MLFRSPKEPRLELGPVGPLDSPLPGPHVMETGQAGPPGTKASSRLPKGTDGSMTPLKGFAGAPGRSSDPGEDEWDIELLAALCIFIYVIVFSVSVCMSAKPHEIPPFCSSSTHLNGVCKAQFAYAVRCVPLISLVLCHHTPVHLLMLTRQNNSASFSQQLTFH